MERTNLGRQFNDVAITTLVNNRLCSDGRFPNFGIDVTTRNGIVFLSGEIESEEAFYSAIQIAYATTGVNDVHPYNLRIKHSDEDLMEVGLNFLQELLPMDFHR